jgi:hypothetical protein
MTTKCTGLPVVAVAVALIFGPATGANAQAE